jgi:hypothetical protein
VNTGIIGPGERFGCLRWHCTRKLVGKLELRVQGCPWNEASNWHQLSTLASFARNAERKLWQRAGRSRLEDSVELGCGDSRRPRAHRHAATARLHINNRAVREASQTESMPTPHSAPSSPRPSQLGTVRPTRVAAFFGRFEGW